jgi:methylthioribulose-1-phosphate dehydratase
MLDVTQELMRIGRRFDARGWMLGTSGNLSAVIARDPLRLAITRSGTHKGELGPADILEIGADGAVQGMGAPSAETRLHVEVVRARGAGAVLHTHSVWSTVLSGRFGDARGVEISGYEMLKGLAGVTTHEHREWLPVLENDQDMTRLAAEVRKTLDTCPDAHGFLLRRHGLYTWGATLAEAARHIEILEFLLESLGREKEAASWRS